MNPGKDRVDPYDTEDAGAHDDNDRRMMVFPIPRDAAIVQSIKEDTQ